MIPPGTIGVPTADWTRFPRFWMCVNAVEAPDGTITSYNNGIYAAVNRNVLIYNMAGDWIWCLDDDHIFPPDTLMRLLERMYEKDLDVLAALYCQRVSPFPNTIVTIKDGQYLFGAPLPEDEDTIEVDAVGSGGMLIRRRVFERFEMPWFSYGVADDGGIVGEDIVFCEKVRAAGMKVHVALDIPLGHIGTFEVWPTRDGARLDVGDQIFTV